MEPISQRQCQITALLLERSGEITAGAIAEELKISVRTVHRELAGIELFLRKCGLMLQKKSGSGMWIEGDEPAIRKAKAALTKMEVSEYTGEDREIFIVSLLLEADEPIKLFSLAKEAKVTAATIASDLDKWEEWLGRLGLNLVRRRGYGVELEGTEADRRRAIWLLAREQLDESELFGAGPSSSYSPLTRRLLEMAGQPYIHKIDEALWQLEELGLDRFSELAYTDLLLQLSTAMSRMERGHFIRRAARLPDGIQGSLTDKGMQLTDWFTERLQLNLPPEEKAYISARFATALHADRQLSDLHENVRLTKVVNRLINRMTELQGVPYTEDRLLREGLVQHLQPALNRMERHERIRNPLLATIKRNYEKLFALVEQAVRESKLNFPDAEIGFLVMHFGASHERYKHIHRNIRALIVCPSGIGSSAMLAARLGKEFPQIQVIRRMSWNEVARHSNESYDLIISTVELPLDEEAYVKVSPLLAEEDADRLRRFIRLQSLDRRSSAASHAWESGMTSRPLQKLYRLKAYTEETVRLMDGFDLFELRNPHSDLSTVLDDICELGCSAGILHSPEKVSERLMEREKQGSLLIPDSNLALFHTRSKEIERSWLALIHLETPVVLPHEEQEEVTRMLLMLGPEVLSKESLEVLSEISAMLLIPEVIEILQHGEKDQIRSAIAGKLATFISLTMEMESDQT